MKYQEISEKLQKYFELEGSPVAHTFLIRAPSDAKRTEGDLTWCQALPFARFEGAVTNLTRENFAPSPKGCGFVGPGLLGLLPERDPKWQSGERLFDEKAFPTPMVARRAAHSCPGMDPGTVEMLSIAPLEKHVYEPEVITVITNPHTALKIAKAAYHKVGPPQVNFPLWTAGCKGAIVYPHQTGKLSVTLGDPVANKFAKLKQEELFVGIPVELLRPIINNFEEYSKKWIYDKYST